MLDNPRKNNEGYNDPTAYEGLKPVIYEENAICKDVSALISVLRFIISKSGYELINRIEIKDKKTGRIFK